jgi:Tol biopolymer transport system component
VETLVTIGKLIASPRLSADGRQLYVLEDQSTLVRYDLRTKQPTTVASARAFALSRDGSRLALTVRDGTRLALKVQRSDGTSVTELLNYGPNENIVSVAWADDGASLFFAKTWLGDGPQKVEVFRVNAAGGQKPVPLGLTLLSLATLSVHPQGDRLAFIDNEWAVEFWQMNGLMDAFRSATRRGASGSSQLGAAPAANR